MVVARARTAVAQAVRVHFHVVKAAGRRVLALRVTLGRVVGPRGRLGRQVDSRAHVGRRAAAVAAHQRLEAASQATDVAEHDLFASGRDAARERPRQPYAAARPERAAGPALARVQQLFVHAKGLRVAAAEAESQAQRFDLHAVAAVGRERHVVDARRRRHRYRGLVLRGRSHELHALVDTRAVGAADGARGPLEPRHVGRQARVVVGQEREPASRARGFGGPHPRPDRHAVAVGPHDRAQLVRGPGQPPEVHQLEAGRVRGGPGGRDRVRREQGDGGGGGDDERRDRVPPARRSRSRTPTHRGGRCVVILCSRTLRVVNCTRTGARDCENVPWPLRLAECLRADVVLLMRRTTVRAAFIRTRRGALARLHATKRKTRLLGKEKHSANAVCVEVAC